MATDDVKRCFEGPKESKPMQPDQFVHPRPTYVKPPRPETFTVWCKGGDCPGHDIPECGKALIDPTSPAQSGAVSVEGLRHFAATTENEAGTWCPNCRQRVEYGICLTAPFCIGTFARRALASESGRPGMLREVVDELRKIPLEEDAE